MTVTMPEKNWTASRLDDLKEAVDSGHKEMRAGFSELRGEMKAGYDKLDDKMDAGFARLDSRFYRLMTVLVVGLVSIIGTMIGLRIF